MDLLAPKIDPIVLPFHDWKKNETDGLRNRDGHLIRWMLASDRVGKVLFVDRPISLAERWIKRRPLRCRSGREIARRGRAILSEIEPKLFVLDCSSPDLLSPLLLGRDWWDAAMRRDETIESIRWAADRIGSTADRRALLCWSPLATGPIGRVGERAVHFDADDNWTRHPEMRDRRGWIRRGYQAACDRADVLTCNSEATGRFLESLGGRPTVIRNGVDPEFWDPARVAGEPAPAALGSIPRPRIGYAGRLAKRIDVALLLELARRRPEWSFVTIGPTLDARRIAPLKRAPNVHFLGDVNYERLPAFVAAFDVAIVPHRVGELENDGDPTKLYEYLALGLPVVTTPIAGVETFRDWIAIADGADAFEAAIDRFLRFADSGDETARAARRAAVDRPEHHWKSKAEAMLESIDAAMRRKSGGA